MGQSYFERLKLIVFSYKFLNRKISKCEAFCIESNQKTSRHILVKWTNEI
jgi:hypothetical protein